MENIYIYIIQNKLKKEAIWMYFIFYDWVNKIYLSLIDQ